MMDHDRNIRANGGAGFAGGSLTRNCRFWCLKGNSSI